jgi:hypothetical protein
MCFSGAQDVFWCDSGGTDSASPEHQIITHVESYASQQYA